MNYIEGNPLNKQLVLLVGVPAAGKSTYLSTMLPDLKEKGAKAIVLSSDALIEEYAASKGKTYDQVFTECVNECVAKFFSQLRESFDTHDVIFVDRTNLTPKTRQTILETIPLHYLAMTDVHVVVFHIDERTQAERLKNRPGKSIPWNVIKAMRDSFVEPSDQEYPFKSITSVNSGR